MKIKVCGMRDAENIRAVERLDIDWMGFIFYPRSPRCVPDEEPYAEAIRRCTKTKVGVFVNAGREEMEDKASRYGLSCLQLHGSESPVLCEALRQQGYCVVKAFSVAEAGDLMLADAYASHADYFLFDTKGDVYGGSGKSFDWRALDAYRGETPFLLGGGIHPASLCELRRLAHPRMAGIDVNSGFETAPALKDIARLEAFINQFKNKQESI
ncbi:MAG: phosphoribosylanthranilate isomerase [Tannerella sp.]|jgi:phosphoribosylanthranilate isomerase|nr:phosphoribosylanthranilate isomerase [Tannerella sp.]